MSEEKEVKISFDDIVLKFIKKSEYRDLIRPPIARHTQKYSEGCVYWDGKYWASCDRNILEADLNSCITELGEVKRNRQDAYCKDFISHFAKTENEMNLDSDFLLVVQNGVVDLRNVLEIWKMMANPTVKELWKQKDKWLFSHEDFKANHLTHIANVFIPDEWDDEKYDEEIEFFHKTLLVTFGGEEESFQWFLNYIAVSLTGENTGNTFCNLYGKQKTGKSTIKDFLADLFGSYFQPITTDCLFKESYNNLEQLYNSRNAKLVNISEPNNEKKDVSLLKRVTGHDPLVFYRTTFNFKASIIVDSNHLIEPKEKDTGGFDRRYAILPCGPVVQHPDSDLINKLKARKKSFFMDLLVRYCIFMAEREQSNKTLEKPAITEKTLEIINKFKNPIKWFFHSWCTPFPSGIPFIGGTDVRLTDIRAIFKQGFIDFYNKQFEELYFSSNDFYVPLTMISAQKFDAVMKSYHFNYDTNVQGKYITFHNFIVQQPGINQTVRDFYRNQLISFRYAKNLEEAENILNQASKMPTILKKENIYEDNYTDLLGSMEFPSFGFFNIIASREAWMSHMLQFILCNGLLISAGNIFTNWLYRTVEQNTAVEIINKLRTAVMNCNCIYDTCYHNLDVISILSTLFDSYVYTSRENKKQSKNLIQPMNSCLRINC